MRVALLLFDQVDLLDVGGPYEVFLTAGRLAERRGQPNPFDVLTVSATDEAVEAYGGMGLTPSHRLRDAIGCDVVVVPGAVDIHAVARETAVRSAVTALSSASEITASVCTGAFLLAEAGLLDEGDYTTHWEDLRSLADILGRGSTAGASRWVDNGAVLTAGGLSAGISMALHLVARAAGRSLAEETARQLVFAWDADDPTYP